MALSKVTASLRTGLAPFRASRLSSAHRGCRGGLPLWMSSWHARQTTRVLRWRAAIRLAHSGGLPFPLRLRSLSALVWCTSTCFRDPHSSYSATSRWTISERWLQMRAGSSLRAVVWCPVPGRCLPIAGIHTTRVFLRIRAWSCAHPGCDPPHKVGGVVVKIDRLVAPDMSGRVGSCFVGEREASPGHVFISYVHENSRAVDQLQHALEAAGIQVWRDKADIWPGEDWRTKIRSAITNDALVFIVCFSRESNARRVSYQNEELVLAIDEMRKRAPDTPWLMPVRLDDCEIPDRDIGGGRTLKSIQWADLFGNDAQSGIDRLVAAVHRILGMYSVAPSIGSHKFNTAMEEVSAVEHKQSRLDQAQREDHGFGLIPSSSGEKPPPRGLGMVSILKRLRFGVEVELVGLSTEDAERVVRECLGGQYDHLGREWSVCTDSSVAEGFELVTPAIYYADVPSLQEIFRQLRQAGARRDPTAGVHIHVGAESLSIGALRSLVNMYSTHAELILRMLNVYPARRIFYARSIQPYAEAVNNENPSTMAEMKRIWYEVSGSADKPVSRYNKSRYTELNLNSYFYRSTIEFRVFNSTNHAGKLRSYVTLILSMVDFAHSYPGLYPLSTMEFRDEAEALDAASEFFQLVNLDGREHRVVRSHLVSNIRHYYARVRQPTKRSVIFEGLGMAFDGASFAEVLDEMVDNRFFDQPKVQDFVYRIRGQKSIDHKPGVMRELLSMERYEDYAATLIRSLDSYDVGKLTVVD